MEQRPPSTPAPVDPSPEVARTEEASATPTGGDRVPDEGHRPAPAGEAPAGDARPTLDLDAVTADLAAVEAALERLDQGGYGRCGACASTIDDDVLAADPTATTCAAHLPV